MCISMPSFLTNQCKRTDTANSLNQQRPWGRRSTYELDYGEKKSNCSLGSDVVDVRRAEKSFLTSLIIDDCFFNIRTVHHSDTPKGQFNLVPSEEEDDSSGPELTDYWCTLSADDLERTLVLNRLDLNCLNISSFEYLSN